MLLKSVKDVAQRWYTFLTNKFAATQAETQRQGMEEMPDTKNSDALSESEILEGLSKIKHSKATGMEMAFLSKCFRHAQQASVYWSHYCKEYRIWDEDEIVPSEFGVAKFAMLFKNKGSADR